MINGGEVNTNHLVCPGQTFFPYHFKIVSAVPVVFNLLRTIIVTMKAKKMGEFCLFFPLTS